MNAEISEAARLEGSSRMTRYRALGSACLAHVLHDGYTDLLYLLFPIWQGEFGLSLALIGVMKTLFSGALSLFQIPAAMLAKRFGGRVILAGGTVLIASAVLFYGAASSAYALFGLLLLGGLGTAVQHPLSSSIVAHAFANSRTALGFYNFAGDAGKVLLPSAAAFIIWFDGWRTATSMLGSAGIVLGVALFWLISNIEPEKLAAPPEEAAVDVSPASQSDALKAGFASLTAIGIFDNATRTGFLTFMPLLLSQKGANAALIGTALSLIFIGGAAGKFICGVVAERFGVISTVIATEALTAALISSLLFLQLDSVFILLVPLGIALNGTSSVLYGSVAELAPRSRRAHAFAIFYTATLGAGALAPTLFGLLGDGIGLAKTILCVAGLPLFTLPLAFQLAGKFKPAYP